MRIVVAVVAVTMTCINVDAANHSDATLEIAMFCTELDVSLGGGCFYNYGSV